MRVLLDTCVLAELRNPHGHSAVQASVALIPADNLFLSVLVLGEIARGVALLTDGRKQRALSTWLTVLKGQFTDRILPVDSEIAYLWGNLSARAEQAGIILPSIDGLLAATALRHGLYFMTHNMPHFAATGALIIDPWNACNENDKVDGEVKIG